VPPGEVIRFPVQPLVSGTFDYFCMTESEHVALVGTANPFLCSLNSFDLSSQAYSRGRLRVEPNERLNEYLRSASS
jgi:hypothetical protein